MVIPCYRYGRYLPVAVDSVLSQHGVDVEVIIIDDASDDGSADVARALERGDERVRVIAHTVNAGHIATYNEGLNQARGEYVVLLSADDALVAGSLSRAVAVMQRFPGVGMVYGHSRSFDGDLPVVDGRPRSWTVWRGSEWLTSMCGRAVNPVYTPGVVLRKIAWDAIGRYDRRVPHAADMLLWYQVACLWDIARVNNDAQALYRVHGANMHMTQFSGMLRDMTEQREVMRILFEESPGELRPPSELRRRGYRALARRARRLAASADDPASAAAYRDFGDETVDVLPAARPSGLADRYDRWIETRSASLIRRSIRHLEWRRWRRFGT